MKSLKKKTVLLIIAIFLSSSAFLSAQISCDPSDEFYIMAQGWELRGVVDKLPSLRPYPVQVIKSIINQVMEKGTELDKRIAKEYYNYVFGKTWNVELETIDNVKLVHGDDSTGNQLLLNPSVQGDISILNDFITAGFKLGLYNTNADSSQFLPIYQNIMYDSIQDPASIGSFDSYMNANTCVAIGNKNLYLQAGVYRTGFGSYINEGLALNDSSYHAANISFHINNSKWAYSQQLSALGATTNNGSGLYANKFLSFHEVDFFFAPILSLTYYETIVYGNRFDPSYLFPSPYMVTQGINGCQDNLQMGLAFSYKPLSGFAWNTDIFVDDLSINELAKFNLDSKNRFAVKSGVIYTPINSLCSRLALDYTVITPYMYSHWDYDNSDDNSMTDTTVNYQNYTNNGINIGSSYSPNSDRISFTMNLHPASCLNIEISSAFMRHANVCESLSDSEALKYLLAKKGVYSTDGSIFTHSMFSGAETIDTAWNHLNFLKQDHKMYIIQAGISSSYALERFKWGQVSFKLSYTFEYIYNKGVDSDLYEGGNTTENSDGTYTWNGTTYSSASALVSAVKSDWITSFYDVMENFFSLGIVFNY